jgi:hypothetical protein
MLKKLLKGVGVTLGVLLAVAALLYAFGGMWPPSAGARAAYAAEVSTGRQPAVQERFTIPVPGCVCHSDDPVLQLQHSTRRINECSRCHG